MSKTTRVARRAVLGVTTLGVVAGLLTPTSASATITSPPTGLAPANTGTAQYKNVELTWAAVSGATSYEVQVDDDLSFSDDVLTGTSSIAAFTVPVKLPRGGYAWRVRAKSGTTTGPWSAAVQFVRGWDDKPTGLGALPGPVPRLSWTPMADASFYEVEISDQPFSTSPSDTGRKNHWVCFTNHTTLTPYGVAAGLENPPGAEDKCPFTQDWKAKPNPDGTFPDEYFTKKDLSKEKPENWPLDTVFHWRVRGRDTTIDEQATPFLDPAAACTGVWPESGGAPSSDGVTIPLPSSPPDYAKKPECSRWSDGATLTINPWSAHPYVLYPVDVDGTLTDVPAVTTHGGCYEIKTGDLGTPPEGYVRSVRYEAMVELVGPSTTAPASMSTGPKTTMKARTHVGVKTDAGFTLTSTKSYAAAGAASTGTYYLTATCFARVVDTSEAQDAWGEKHVVSVEDLGPVDWMHSAPVTFKDGSYHVLPIAKAQMNVQPVAGSGLPNADAVAVTDTPRFSWSAVPGALKYRVYVSRTADFRDADHIWETKGLELQPVGDFADRALPTYWTVQACHAFRCGDVAAMKSFTKTANATVQPVSATKSANSVVLTWKTAYGTGTPAGSVVSSNPEVKNYQLQLDEVGGDFSTPVESIGTDRIGMTAGRSVYRLNALDAPDQFMWRVRGVTETGYGLPWSSAQAFDVTNPIASITTPTAFPATTPLKITFTEPVNGVSTSTLRVVPVDAPTSPVTGTLTKLTSTSWSFLPTSGFWETGRSYKLSVSGITDLTGLAAVASSTSVRSTRKLDNSSPAMIKHSGDWGWTTYSASDAYGGTYSMSKDVTSTAIRSNVQVMGYGSKAYLYLCKGPSGGIAKFYVDGVLYATIDTYRSYSGCGHFYTSPTLTTKLHSFRVYTTGTKNASSKSTEVSVDAITIM